MPAGKITERAMREAEAAVEMKVRLMVEVRVLVLVLVLVKMRVLVLVLVKVLLLSGVGAGAGGSAGIGAGADAGAGAGAGTDAGAGAVVDACVGASRCRRGCGCKSGCPCECGCGCEHHEGHAGVRYRLRSTIREVAKSGPRDQRSPGGRTHPGKEACESCQGRGGQPKSRRAFAQAIRVVPILRTKSSSSALEMVSGGPPSIMPRSGIE